MIADANVTLSNAKWPNRDPFLDEGFAAIQWGIFLEKTRFSYLEPSRFLEDPNLYDFVINVKGSVPCIYTSPTMNWRYAVSIHSIAASNSSSGTVAKLVAESLIA